MSGGTAADACGGAGGVAAPSVQSHVGAATINRKLPALSAFYAHPAVDRRMGMRGGDVSGYRRGG